MRYIALIRGVGPGNPNMKGDRLKNAFETLGFRNVHPVIASGNVVFDSSSKDMEALEKKIEQGLEKLLHFRREVFVRNQREIEVLVKKNPFKKVKDEHPNYLIVTFLKKPRRELCTVMDMNTTDGPKMMRSLDTTHGKSITTRTWKTVNRILKKIQSV